MSTQTHYNHIVQSQWKTENFEISKRKITHNEQGLLHKQIYQQKACRLEGWNDILKTLKEEKFQPRILYLTKVSFKNVGAMITFSDKQNWWEFFKLKLKESKQQCVNK